jgi:hypothetical protein
MKRIFILLTVVVLVTSLSFAQEYDGQEINDQPSSGTTTGGTTSGDTSSGETPRKIEPYNAEINIGFPVHWTNGFHEPVEDKTVTANSSVGIGITFNFTEKVGLIMEGDISYGAEITGVSAPTSNYISLVGANIFVGPLFYLFNNNTFRVPLAIGIHMYYFSDDLWVPALDGSGGAWISRDDTQFGLGFSLGFQLHFNSGIYLFSRTSVLFDFIRLHTSEGGDLTTYDAGEACLDIFPLSWFIKPSAGIGIRF